MSAEVREVLITPSLFRRFICTDGCTACCQKFTLDYVPSEFVNVEHQEGFEEREVWVNGKKKIVWTNDQNQNPICDFLTALRPGGSSLGCAQWPTPPLSCISAPQLQFIQMRPERTYVLKKPFGRAWAMTPTPQCQFVEIDWGGSEALAEWQMMDRILARFQEWARYFGIKSTVPLVRKELKRLFAAGLVPVQAYSVWRAE